MDLPGALAGTLATAGLLVVAAVAAARGIEAPQERADVNGHPQGPADDC